MNYRISIIFLLFWVSIPNPEGKDVLNETGERKRKRSNLSAVAQVCDGAGVSGRTAALLSSSLLLGIGHINNSDQIAVIDRHKIRRERSKLCKNVQKCIDADLDDPFALSFDGRIDKTLRHINKDYKCSKSLVSEEHICLLQEPRSSYVGHVSPTTGSSKNISEEILEVLNSSLMLEQLDVTELTLTLAPKMK